MPWVAPAPGVIAPCRSLQVDGGMRMSMSMVGHGEGWQALTWDGCVQATAENSASSESRAQSLLSSVVQISK